MVERSGTDGPAVSPRSDASEARAADEAESSDRNPLRMLRAGVPVRPKVRGNKHNIGGGFSTIERSQGMRSSGRNCKENSSVDTQNNFDAVNRQTLPRGFKHGKVPPPVKPKPSPLMIQNCNSQFSSSTEIEDRISSDLDLGSPDNYLCDSQDLNANNPLPLPPRDRTKPNVAAGKPRHQRKHPLIIPGGVTNSLLRGGGHLSSVSLSDKSEVPGRLVIQHTHNPQLETHASSLDHKMQSSVTSLHLSNNSVNPTARVPPAKPPRLFT